MQRTGQTLPRQAARRPSRVPAHPSLNRRCNTRAFGQIEHDPENGIFVLNLPQFGRPGPPLWIRRAGLGPRTLPPERIVAAPFGLNTFSSKPRLARPEPDGCSRHPVGAVNTSDLLTN